MVKIMSVFWFVSLFGFAVPSTDFSTLDHIISRTPAASQAEAAQELIGRILRRRYTQFQAFVQPDLGPRHKDTFKLTSNATHVNITGTTGVAVTMGFYYYLTNYCGCQLTWAGQQLNLPKMLPVIPKPGIKVTTNDRFRYYQNVCTVSYSFVWYTWDEWERQIDWMALRGINLPLAFTGQEAVLIRVYKGFGLNEADLQTYFGGPAFLAWTRMGNMHGWGGPLSEEWLTDQISLQRMILQRMRSLGMIPVLPGFSGVVPQHITRVFPNANVSHLPDWGHFNTSRYCCDVLLDFDDPLFKKIGTAITQEIIREFGTDHIYNIDTFNEMKPKTNSTAYLAHSAEVIYSTLTAADPDAVWLMQGWLFTTSVFWQPPQIKALLTAVPKGRMVILDLFSEVYPVFQRTESYYGQPFIWCMLHNFGGTMELYGRLDSINTGPFDGRAFPNSTMIGIGMTPEGINQNEVIYEFFAENSWRTKPQNKAQWLATYAVRRYGKTDKDVAVAWQYLMKSVYNNTDHLKDKSKQVVPTSRPQLKVLKPDVWYDPEDLYKAWDHFVMATDSLSSSDLFLYDLVDVTRNSLQLLSLQYYHQVVAAFHKKDFKTISTVGDRMLSMLEVMDYVLGSDPRFLLGKWLYAAKLAGINDQEKMQYEFNARNQITLWGPSGQHLDYASKQWSGLLNGYYRKRWELFIEELKRCLKHGIDFDQAAYNNKVYSKVEWPFQWDRTVYPIYPTGNTVAMVKAVHKKYRPQMFQHFTFKSGKPLWYNSR